jgi:inorganic pyrophosphatase
MTAIDELGTFDDDGRTRVVIESPRGSRVKLAFDPATGVFVAKRTLPVGLAYPYDWGFVAGTLAADGDPLDALVLADYGTWPGVVVASIPIGVVRVVQRETARARPVRNDRVIVVPAEDAHHADVAALPEGLRRALTAFFERVGELAHADVRVTSWAGPAAARRAIRAARERRG